MAIFHVQRQYWQRWPRVLIVERTNDDGSKEERRYVPEGGTRDEWNGRVRETLRKFNDAKAKYDAMMADMADIPSFQAEIDGLRWGVEERDELIRDMFHMLVGHAVDQYVDEEEWESVMSRVVEFGIEL